MTNEGRRTEAYAKVFGAECEQFADDEGSPAIEVRRYTGAPVSGGPVCDTWVSFGMSDVAMQNDDELPLRRELIFYAPTGGNFAVPLRAIASYPFENETYLEHGHSIQTFGTLFLPGGAEALLAEEPPPIELPHLVLLSPLLRQHRRLSEELEIEGCAVELLWVVPISAAEHALKRKQGTNALLDLFEQRRHPWLFDPTRQSYL
jgi:hypothetical protein